MSSTVPNISVLCELQKLFSPAHCRRGSRYNPISLLHSYALVQCHRGMTNILHFYDWLLPAFAVADLPAPMPMLLRKEKFRFPQEAFYSFDISCRHNLFLISQRQRQEA